MNLTRFCIESASEGCK